MRSHDARVGRLAAALDAPPDTLRWVRAPGRVNLMGDHTDYHDGFVLPCAIDRDCLLAARPRPDRLVRVRSLDEPGPVVLDLDEASPAPPGEVRPAWGRFVAGVVASLDAPEHGFDAVVASTVPVGAGLSSSSALTIALVLALGGAAPDADAHFDPRAVARLALDAEIRATGVPGGPMDQLTCLLGRAGHALLVDCRILAVEPVPLPADLAILVVHSGVGRTLAGSEYAARRRACDAAADRLGVSTLRDATLDRVRTDPIARHVVTENARVLATASALRAGDTAALGPLLSESHESLRTDFRVSTPELDALVAALVDAGALGARLTGAGFGGCVVALVARDAVEAVASGATAAYRRATGREPSAFVVRAVDGARVETPS